MGLDGVLGGGIGGRGLPPSSLTQTGPSHSHRNPAVAPTQKKYFEARSFNLKRLKFLEYLNISMNVIETIEGLDGCENLRKLDLTLNFVGQLSSVLSLRKNQHLEELYLVGWYYSLS